MILIGGSPSTGSSLLVNILNRHSQVFSGSETYLFLHKNLSENWNKYKSRLLNTGKIRGLKSPAWFIFNGVLLENEDYGWTKAELSIIIAQSKTYETFLESYFSRPLQRNNKTVWIEKSPANSFNFEFFINKYPSAKVIQVLRNPYDTAASLMSRGHDVWFSVGRCLFSNARALAVRNSPNYYSIRYEDLTTKPEEEVGKLLDFLDLKQETNLLEPTEKERVKMVQMKGWQHNEHGKIGKTSVGRFQKMSQDEQRLIKATFSAFRMNERYVQDPKLISAKDIFSILGYEYFYENPKDYRAKLHEFRTRDILKRTLRLYPNGIGNYLGDIFREK